MYKLHIKTPNIKITKPSLLIIASVGIVLLLVIVGAAGYQRSTQIKAQNSAVLRETAIKAENVRKAEVASLKAQVTASEAKRTQVCDYVALKAKTRPTAGLITTPVLACAK